MYNSGSAKPRRASVAPSPIDIHATRKRSSSLSVSYPTPLSPTSRRVADLIPISSSPSQSFSGLLQLHISPSPSPHPISSSPSHSLSNLLQPNLGIHAPELSVRLQKLKISGEKFGEKSGEKLGEKPISENTEAKSGLTKSGDSKTGLSRSGDALSKSGGSEKNNGQTESNDVSSGPPTKGLPDREAATPMALYELEVELKKEMQEIQALKLGLESGGMGLKERGETHHRFVGLLQHLKTTLATYKEMRRDVKGDEATYNTAQRTGGEELAKLVEETPTLV